MLTTWKMNNGTNGTRIHVGWDHDPEAEDGVDDPIVVTVLDLIERWTYLAASNSGPPHGSPQ